MKEIDTVSKLNEKISEIDSQIETLEEIRSKLSSKKWELEREFGNGGPCPECGHPESTFNRGFGRGYTIECDDCGFTVHGSD